VLRFSPAAASTAARLTIKGRATDASGIRDVRFKLGGKGFKKARGATHWKFTAKLKPGKNKLLTRATDKAGLTSLSRLTIIRH
jgi:hypothetical protein